MPQIKTSNRVRETTITTGTGTVTLGGAVTGFRTFSSAMATNELCYYVIEDLNKTEWEIGIGKKLSSPDQLQRLVVFNSSNSDSLVNFSSGTKFVYISSTEAFYNPLKHPKFSYTSSNKLNGTLTNKITSSNFSPVAFGLTTTKLAIDSIILKSNQTLLVANSADTTNEIAYVSIDTKTGSAITNGTLVTGQRSENLSLFEMKNGNICLVYRDVVGSNVGYIKEFTPSFQEVSNKTWTTTNSIHFRAIQLPNGNIAIVYNDGTNGRLSVLDSDFSQLHDIQIISGSCQDISLDVTKSGALAMIYSDGTSDFFDIVSLEGISEIGSRITINATILTPTYKRRNIVRVLPNGTISIVYNHTTNGGFYQKLMKWDGLTEISNTSIAGSFLPSTAYIDAVVIGDDNLGLIFQDNTTSTLIITKVSTNSVVYNMASSTELTSNLIRVGSIVFDEFKNTVICAMSPAATSTTIDSHIFVPSINFSDSAFNSKRYISTDATNNELVLYAPNSTGSSRLRLTNSTYGTTSTDGFVIDIDSTNSRVWNYENNDIVFGTGNTEFMRFNYASNLISVANRIDFPRIYTTNFADGAIQISHYGSGNRVAYLDLVGDDTYTDYGLRIIRNNTGANTDSDLIHRGTGSLNLRTLEAGAIKFQTSNVTRALIDAASPVLSLGYSGASTSSLILGAGGTGNRNSIIDLISDNTYTSYGFRLIRYNTGANSDTDLIHRGTGTLKLFATDAGAIWFVTSSTIRVKIDPSNPILSLGFSGALTSTIKIGTGGTGNRYAELVLIGDDIYTDYGFRIQRDNTGSNAITSLNHRGTGALKFNTVDAAPVELWSNGIQHLYVSSSKTFISGNVNGVIEIIGPGSGNRYAILDLVGDDIYTDYGFRVARNNTGANTNSDLIHRGTGSLNLRTLEAGTIKFETTNTTRVIIDSAEPIIRVGYSGASTSGLVLGSGSSGNRYCLMDFITDDFYTTYGFRIIRYNSGSNADTDILHRGTGSLKLITQDAGAIWFLTSNTIRVVLEAANPVLNLGYSGAASSIINIGAGGTGNRNAIVDFIGDDIYTDYGFRLIRNNSGANSNTDLRHRGTGVLNLITEESAAIFFYTSNVARLAIDQSNPILYLGYSGASTSTIKMGYGGSTNRAANIDLIGDDTYTDYGLRIIRNNTGANTSSDLIHRGVGALNFNAVDAGSIYFFTSNTNRLNIDSTGIVTVENQINFSKHYTNSFGGGIIKLGYYDTGNRTTILDLVSDATYTDFGFRIIRYNSGANSNTDIRHRGTGSLVIRTDDAGQMSFLTNSTLRLAIGASTGTITASTALVAIDNGANQNVSFKMGNTTATSNNDSTIVMNSGDLGAYPFGFMILRGNGTSYGGSGLSSPNSDTAFVHYGTGAFIFNSMNSGPIGFKNNTASIMDISSSVTIYTPSLISTANASGSVLDVLDSNASFVGNHLLIRSSRTASSAFSPLVVTSNNGASVDFRFSGDAIGYSDGGWTSPAADYAEYFEWLDGNPDNIDRVGQTVSLVGNKIKIAETGETVIGVVSSMPGVVGDAAWNNWKDRYLKDDYGRYIMEDYDVVTWIDENGTEQYQNLEDMDQNNLPENYSIITQQRRKVNPNYDPDLPYISREYRKEWSPIGLVGKLYVRSGEIIDPRWVLMETNESTGVNVYLVR